jgi:hypothetical protein
MGFLKATYRFFKDLISPDKKHNIELIKTYMKVCVQHYHSLLPQLDLIATQWGVDPVDNLESDIGLLRLEGERSKRQKVLDEQLRNQVRDARMQQVGGQGQNNPVASGSLASSRLINQTKSSNQPPSEAVDRLTKQNKEEVRKRGDTEQMLSKIEEDYRLFCHQQSIFYFFFTHLFFGITKP